MIVASRPCFATVEGATQRLFCMTGTISDIRHEPHLVGSTAGYYSHGREDVALHQGERENKSSLSRLDGQTANMPRHGWHEHERIPVTRPRP